MSDLATLLELHARYATQAGADNRRPWLAEFIRLPGVASRLAARVEVLVADPRHVEGRGVRVQRLKPALDLRSLCLPEVEVEIAMMVAAAPLVADLEARRVTSISYAAPVTFHPDQSDFWAIRPFRPSQLRDFNRQRSGLKDHCAWIGESDIHQYFPSVLLRCAYHQLRRHSAVDEPTIKQALALLSRLDPSLETLPVGPQLSSVIGNALPTSGDGWLSWALGPEGATRWMDDYTVGAASHRDTARILDHLERTTIAALGCRFHPAKRRVIPAELSNPRSKISLVAADQYVDPEPGNADAQLLTRNQARHRINEIVATFDDPEHAAQTIADEFDRFRADVPGVIRAVGELTEGAVSGEVADSLCARLREHARTRLADDAANALIGLTDYEFRPSDRGQSLLVDTASNADVAPRTRAAAGWNLAATTGTFDQRILDSLDTIRPYGARALVAAAARAGHSPTDWQLGRAIN